MLIIRYSAYQSQIPGIHRYASDAFDFDRIIFIVTGPLTRNTHGS